MDLTEQVMVVDDDPAICGFLRSFLEVRGYRAFTATHADDALRRFRTERPAAVLLDIVMHGRSDGLTALAAFKSIDKDIPVIMVSGEEGAATIVQAMKLGANDFVRKPFEDADLEVALRNALTHHAPAADVPAATPPGHFSLKDISRGAAREAERDLILRMLTRTHWNRKETAENLGVSYRALRSKIKESGLDKAS